MRRVWLAALLLVGCASGRVMLVPGDGAAPYEGDSDAAVAKATGISLAVDGTAWKGVPVSERITPLWVHIENEGQAPIEIHAADFALTSPGHEARPALTPLLAADTHVDEVSPGDPSGDDAAASCPALNGGIGGAGMGDAYVPVQVSNAQALRANALPEGSLPPGAHVEGYLYFDHVDGLGPAVLLQARIPDAQKKVSELQVPLAVTRG